VRDLLFNFLLILVDLYVIVTIARAKRVRAGLAAVAGGLLAALVLTMLLQTGTFHLIRLYAFVVFAHIPVVMVGIAWALRVRARWIALGAASAAILIWAIAVDAFLIEPRRLEVSRVELRSPKLTRPVRIAVVADLQADRIGDHERRALETVLESEPDLILMPGDYLHVGPRDYPRVAAELAELLRELDFGAPLGAFAVRGNTEYDDWPRLFAGSRVTPLLETSSLDIGGLQLTGLTARDSFDAGLRLDSSSRFHVVLGHAPDFALGDHDADLLIAGHTHGGQVRLPLLGPLMTLSRVPRAWAAGVTALPGDGTLVVSRGIGMERGRAPRLRFLCRPEIVIIEVQPDPTGAANEASTVLPSERISPIVAHFESHGIELKSQSLHGGQHEWISPYPGEPCFNIVIGFRTFGDREEMERQMMRYSAASTPHPTLDIAMFLPFLRGSGGECRDAPVPDLDTVQERFVRVFRLYQPGEAP
jgi:predicted MPP superfamily phosphohydrolase